VIQSVKTNPDGRADMPLVSVDRIDTGRYELVFHAGEYFRSSGVFEPAFFEDITIRFEAADAEGNYHIPLLLAPHGYSTYRGS
jgi:5-hydroxyisourate hydrolase